MLGDQLRGVVQKRIALPEKYWDKPGEPVFFTVRSMRVSEFNEYQEAAMRRGDGSISAGALTMTILENHLVSPNIKDAETLREAGLRSPAELVEAKFTPGLVNYIVQAVREISDLMDFEVLVDEAKNA